MSNSVVPAAAVAHAKQLVKNKKLTKRTEDQKPAPNPRPDAPRLKQSAATATAASPTTRQTDAKNSPKSGRSKNQSLKRIPANEAGQPPLYGQLANVIASKIANGASDESLGRTVNERSV